MEQSNKIELSTRRITKKEAYYSDSTDDDDETDTEDSVEALDLRIGLPPKLQLPESIYTAAIVMPLAFDRKEYGCSSFTNCKKTWILTQVYLLFCANCFIQMGFSYYVMIMWSEQTEGDDNCMKNECAWDSSIVELTGEACGYGTDFKLRGLCLLIFTATILGDMCETGWMCAWIYFSPSTEKVEKIKYGETTQRIKNGLSRPVKFIGIVIILGAKFTIAWFLILWGGGYILGSGSNEDLLLNALAVAFVIGLDEMMYDFMLPRNIRNFVADVNQVQVVSQENSMKYFAMVNSSFGMTCNAAFLAWVTYVTYDFYCAEADDLDTINCLYQPGTNSTRWVAEGLCDANNDFM